MNSKIKKSWVNALRSGNYAQSMGNLRNANGYCCLGVLCDIYSKENNIDWTFQGSYGEENVQAMDYWDFEEEDKFPPQSVKKWSELNDNVIGDLADGNDKGYSFNQIADIIEATL